MKWGKWPGLLDVTVGYYWLDHTSEGRLFALGDPDWSSHEHVGGWMSGTTVMLMTGKIFHAGNWKLGERNRWYGGTAILKVLTHII